MKQHPGNKSSIRSSIEYGGKRYEVEYFETDSFQDLVKQEVVQAYGVCFEGDKMLLVYNGVKTHWGLPGGTIEANESFIQTLKREILEESNYSVESCRPIGYQIVSSLGDSVVQLRYVCIVKREGKFTGDPSGSITKIEMIDPAKYKKYFDWGEIGDAIIRRAIVIKKEM